MADRGLARRGRRSATDAADPNTSHRPRTLFVEPSLLENGAVRLMLDVATACAQRGEPVEVFVVQRLTDGATVPVSDQMPLLFGTEADRRLAATLPGVLARLIRVCLRHDVVISGTEIGTGLILGYAAARLTRRPYGVVVHYPPEQSIDRWIPRRLQGVTRWALRRCDAAVCISPGLVAAATAVGIPARKIHVILNGIDTARIRALAAEEPAISLPAGPTVVGCGRLSPDKGFGVLIEAHAHLRREGVEHSLIIMGDGSEREALTQLAENLGVGDTVHLTGFVSNPHAVVARSTLFCLPSLTEGFGLGLLEALAVGAPIVAADCVTGPSDLLDGGRYGDLVAPGSVPALTAAIRQHLNDPARLRAKSTDAPAWADTFGRDRMVQGYLNLFSDMSQ